MRSRVQICSQRGDIPAFQVLILAQNPVKNGEANFEVALGALYLSTKYNHMATPSLPQCTQEHPHNGYSVQSLILLAIASHMSNNPRVAHESLDLAIDIGLNIGLHTKDFAALHGHGLPILEESWRRTWWQLYMVDVMFAALNHTSKMRLGNVPLEAFLPCEDIDYMTGNVGHSSHWC